MERLTPLFWTIFSAGGTVAALFYPIHLLLVGFAFPLGWVDPPDHAALSRLIAHPVARLYLFAFVSLPMFHWAHRFRYTLYDGLQLKHLTELIAVICYGTALLVTAAAAWTLFGMG